MFDELRRASCGGAADYAGISYERLSAGHGVFWPCPALDHPGTPRLFTDRFPTETGRARFHAVSHRDVAEQPNREFPLYLTTGRVLAQYQSGTQTRRTTILQELQGGPAAEIHPSTAATLGLRDGDPVSLRTRRGTAVFTVKVTTAIREDTVFVPFHWGGEQSANNLTHARLDPTSKMPAFKVCAARADKFVL